MYTLFWRTRSKRYFLFFLKFIEDTPALITRFKLFILDGSDTQTYVGGHPENNRKKTKGICVHFARIWQSSRFL